MKKLHTVKCLQKIISDFDCGKFNKTYYNRNKKPIDEVVKLELKQNSIQSTILLNKNQKIRLKMMNFNVV